MPSQPFDIGRAQSQHPVEPMLEMAPVNPLFSFAPAADRLTLIFEPVPDGSAQVRETG